MTGNGCPIFKPSRTHSSKTDRKSVSHADNDDANEITPVQPGIRPANVPSSNLS